MHLSVRSIVGVSSIQQTTLQFIPSLDADVRNESASATKVVQQTLLFLGIIFCLSRPLRQLAFSALALRRSKSV
jgi:hypothetical protein